MPDKKQLHLKVIACKALLRETCAFVAESDHVVDLEFFGLALHDDPSKMAAELQARIDASAGAGYDAIVIGAGLCGNGVVGVTARDIPLVLPRVDDCAVLFLGSRERFLADHEANPGTYYYLPGWLDQAEPNREQGLFWRPGAQEAIHQHYVERYGEDNADYLMETLHGWQGAYSRACYIDTGLSTEAQLARYRRRTREIAESCGWRYDELRGDPHLMRRLIEGIWPPEQFLIVPPGAQVQPSYDGTIMRTVPSDS